MDIMREKGFDFGFDPSACKSCHGYCCRGTPGHIWVHQSEILCICRYLQTNVVDCMEQYMEKFGNKISIRERFAGQDYECVFFHAPSNRCSIYEVRPSQCRRYPFWDIFRDRKKFVMKECPGIRDPNW